MFQLVTLKAISNALMRRVHRNYRFVISFNFGLIILGVMGVLAPATSALLHNTSTLCISMHSMTNLLKDEEKKERETGMKLGLHWLEEADELWVFGDTVSEGMRYAGLPIFG